MSVRVDRQVAGSGESRSDGNSYYAHTDGSPDQSRWQPLREHLRNVAEMAKRFADEARPGDKDFAKAAYCAGLLHDLGKYRVEFQRMIRGRQPKGESTRHKQAGAAETVITHYLFSVLLAQFPCFRNSDVPILTVSDRRTEWRIMNVSELKKLLSAGEWKDIEFKEARTDVPKSAFETVSAFANSHGGCLVFGVARRDDPPGFRVFREAAVNLLIHQDYGDHSRKAVIKFFRDGIQFWNPGDVFGDYSRLWEPSEKEVRNPSIAMAMRRIAMCEQAGTGLRMMREAWRKLGHPAPHYKNDRAGKAFEFFIPELDKEVDMASDLVKAMFGGSPQVKAQIEAHDLVLQRQIGYNWR